MEQLLMELYVSQQHLSHEALIMNGENTDFTRFERDAIYALLAADNDVCRSLRMQIDSSYVTHRVHTGVGMYVHIQSDVPLPPSNETHSLRFQNAVATIAGLKHGAGFILWVKNGKLSCLEIYTYQEEFPKTGVSYSICNVQV